jgi:hypothetical protein
MELNKKIELTLTAGQIYEVTHSNLFSFLCACNQRENIIYTQQQQQIEVK